jgi:hypothetical protein
MRRSSNHLDAESLLLTLGGIICAGLVWAFLRSSALYLLIAVAILFAIVTWRRRANSADAAIRIGLGAFMLVIAALLVRPHLNLG